MPRQIFRQEALDRLSSPEQLDQLMPVTSPRSWVALAGVGLLLLMALAWGWLGTIPNTVEAKGILARRGGVKPLTAPEAGVVARVAVSSGDGAEKGQELLALTPAGGNREPVPVVSPFPAQVLERRVRVGDTVEKGAPLLTLEPLDEPLQARLFLPVSEGYQVQPGMRVQVWPSFARRSEAGYLVGTVRGAAKYPISQADLVRVVQNEAVARQLAEAGPCLPVFVELTPDPETPGGYRWSSARGPTLPLYTGTPCEGRVVVGEQRPIQLVFPGLGGRGP
jgi:hypothetical protein